MRVAPSRVCDSGDVGVATDGGDIGETGATSHREATSVSMLARHAQGTPSELSPYALPGLLHDPTADDLAARGMPTEIVDAIRKEEARVRDGTLLPRNKSFFLPAATTSALGVAVMFHGFSAGTWQFEHMAKALSDAGLHVYVRRMKGHGRVDGESATVRATGIPSAGRESRYEERAEKTLQELAAFSPLPFYAVGLSGGGAVAAGLASRHPQQFQRLALFDPFFSPHAKRDNLLISAVQWTDRISGGRVGQLFDRRSYPMESSLIDEESYGRQGHAHVSEGNAYALTCMARRAHAQAVASAIPTQIFSTAHESVVSRERLSSLFDAKCRNAGGSDQNGWAEFPAESCVPHAMTHADEYRDKPLSSTEVQARLQFLTDRLRAFLLEGKPTHEVPASNHSR